jgi:nucleotide-binding universal stress UspA family protein
MDVLVATDGSIDPQQAAQFATALAGSEGKTTVVTVVRVPRTLLSDLRARFGESPSAMVDIDAEYVGPQVVEGSPPLGWPGDDAVIAQYLGDKRIERCRPVVEAIRAAGGTAESTVKEGDDVEDEILAAATQLGVGAIVVGSHGHGAFQGLLGSTGAKVVRRATCPVVVLR